MLRVLGYIGPFKGGRLCSRVCPNMFQWRVEQKKSLKLLLGARKLLTTGINCSEWHSKELYKAIWSVLKGCIKLYTAL